MTIPSEGCRRRRRCTLMRRGGNSTDAESASRARAQPISGERRRLMPNFGSREFISQRKCAAQCFLISPRRFSLLFLCRKQRLYFLFRLENRAQLQQNKRLFSLSGAGESTAWLLNDIRAKALGLGSVRKSLCRLIY